VSTRGSTLRRWTSRRAGALLVVPTTLAFLAPTTALADTTPTDDPVDAAAGWLATQLVDGERIETTFDGVTYPDQGLTADTVFTLAGAGVAADEIAAATDWLEEQAGAYTGTAEGDVYAGAAAKLLIVADATGRDTEFGGEDLVALLEGQEDADGRFRDDSEWGDFSNTITQSLAIIALERIEDADPSEDAVSYLVGQACDDGGFPEALDQEDCSGSVDATSFAIQAALAVGEDEVAAEAATWLVDEQADDGSYVGDVPANANSTGLAALALAEAGEDEAAADARAFVLDLQAGCDDDEPGSILYDANDGGDRVRATAQALPGLTGVGLAAVTADGAGSEVPLLDCPSAAPSFDDVHPDSVHREAIEELARREVVFGWPDGTFRPANAVTRGQLASIVARAAGLEPVDGDRFSDVEGSVHEGAIYALEERGIVTGYEDGTFRPAVPVQRDQAASLLARWLGLDPVEEDQFTDLDRTIHRTAINALARIDVARGTEDNTYLPTRSIRRDQTASLVMRALWALEDDGR
jgi:hypothetical protein